jgi:uncharacterized protein (TIGR00297 family)
VLSRALIGAGISLLVVIGARNTRTLSASGAFAAASIGTLAVAAGWTWGLLLLSLFVSASGLSKLGERKKNERVGSIIDKGVERDATQVFANGGVFAAAALGQLLLPSPIWFAIAAGALAASAADTWATEVGTLAGGEPFSIISRKRVPAGTSGGITFVGTVAGVAGALFIAVVATLARWPVPFTAITLGGVGGALADSVLGGTLQARRWCDVCAMSTERLVHNCGTTTRPAGGLAGFDNDLVNGVCSVAGALIASLLS